jgi:hypothetical protein
LLVCLGVVIHELLLRDPRGRLGRLLAMEGDIKFHTRNPQTDRAMAGIRLDKFYDAMNFAIRERQPFRFLATRLHDEKDPGKIALPVDARKPNLRQVRRRLGSRSFHRRSRGQKTKSITFYNDTKATSTGLISSY